MLIVCDRRFSKVILSLTTMSGHSNQLSFQSLTLQPTWIIHRCEAGVCGRVLTSRVIGWSMKIAMPGLDVHWMPH
jgi:hypothetical protein